MSEHRGPDHRGVVRDCIQEIHFCPWPDEERPRRLDYLRGKALSSGEQEVLSLLMGGYRAVDIARKLVVVPKTVEGRISKLLAKLGARTAAQAVYIVMEQREKDRATASTTY